MSLYNAAAFTVDPNFPIPVDAAPAVGMDETGQGDDLQVFSEGWAPDAKITATVAVTDVYVEITLTFATAPDEIDVLWQWGDGTSEYGSALVQGHSYTVPGSYGATATIQRPGEPSVDLYVPVLAGAALQPV